jgi:hypothetical protein
MRQPSAGRSWVSRLGRIALALTTIVVIPFAASQRVIGPRGLLAHPDQRLIELRLEMEQQRLSSPAAAPDWPPLDPPINLRPRPLPYTFHDFIKPAPYSTVPGPAGKPE